MAHRYQLRWIESFAQQLLRGPKRLRLKQLLGIEFLLSVVEAGRSYPTDFVTHALTGYRPHAPQQQGQDVTVLSGRDLREDLLTLADVLSEDAALPPEAYDGDLYTVEALAERFDVSTKTIFRWRRRGLLGWKFRCADHRLRVLFADRCVRRFVSENTELVQRGRNFSQLTALERTRIIDRAVKLVDDGVKTANSVAKVVAEETGRAVETIRLLLKAHDEAHPGAGIFNRHVTHVAPDDQRLAIWSAYSDGAGVSDLATRFAQPERAIYRTITQMRALERVREPIDFIGSDEFASPDAAAIALADPALEQPYRTDGQVVRIPANLPPYLEQLFRLPLLSPAGERALFRKMNYLKFKAEQLRVQLDPEHTTATTLDEIDALLEQAAEIKNQITRANLRLVVNIAKRHASPKLEFFELVSDGNVSLMRAIEKFDYSRGFKFSTYASWAIIKNFARSVPEEHNHHDRYQTGRDEFLDHVALPAEDEALDDQRAAVRGALDRMLGQLEQRDREILRRRFGIDNHGDAQTLEQIGRQLGVSKERVRQLEARAIARLRDEFAEDVTALFAS